jgi:YihY family inner membrane protein
MKVVPEWVSRVAGRPRVAFLLTLRKRMAENGANYLAGTIAFFGFLSLFPLLLLVLSLIGYLIARNPPVEARWMQAVGGAVPGLGSVLGKNLAAIMRARHAIGVAGLAGLWWSGMGVVGAARFALGRSLPVKPAAGGPVRAKLADTLILATLGAVALSSAVLGAFAVASSHAAAPALRVAAGAAVAALDFALFFLSYVLLTRADRSSWRRLWPGALTGAAGWAGLRLAGSWYAARVVTHAAQVYGAFAAALGVMTILFMGARLFVYGAELNGLLIDRRRARRAAAPLSLFRPAALQTRAGETIRVKVGDPARRFALRDRGERLDAGESGELSRQSEAIAAAGWRVVAASLGVAAVAVGTEIASMGSLGASTTAAALAAVAVAALVGGLISGLLGALIVSGWYLGSLAYHGGLFAPELAGVQQLASVSAGALAVGLITGVLQKRSQLFWAERSARIEAQADRKRLKELVDDLESEIVQSKRAMEVGQFLEEVSTILAASLDHRATFKALLQRAAKFFCDYCLIDSVEADRSVRRVAASDFDESWTEAVGAFDRYLNDPDDGHPVVKVLREGKHLIGHEINGAHETKAGTSSVDSYMVLPLTARGRVLGAISFLLIGPGRRYSSEDLGLAQELARRTSLALENALRYQERSRIARILQESLLPSKLPRIPRVDLAAKYRAASEEYDMGGDFYDLFAYGPHGQRWAVVIGDVSGKGAEAAALTGLVRYTVRSEAMQEREPARILSSLNEAILEQSRQDQFCSVVYTRLEPTDVGAHLTLVAAGHPLPLLRRAGGAVEAVGHPGSLMGLFPEVELREYLFDIGPGDTLVFYTDGVTEARGPDDIFGEQRLRAMLADCEGMAAAEIARNIESEVTSFATGTRPDDLAVLVLQIPSVVRLEGPPAEHPQGARQ